MSGPDNVHLVCGGRFHDFDHARLRLLTLLAEHEDVRVTVAPDYRDTETLLAADCLVTYTCDVRPTAPQVDALRRFVEDRRWLALHGTNALFDLDRHGAQPVDEPWLLEVLGSRLLAHPPIHRFPVRIAAPEHPLVIGIDGFETDDELYLCEVANGVDVLLDASFAGTAPGWPRSDWSTPARHPVGYLHGNVYYLTLGHARGHHDLRPIVDWYPRVERGAWSEPAFEELLRRGLAWAARTDPHEGSTT